MIQKRCQNVWRLRGKIVFAFIPLKINVLHDVSLPPGPDGHYATFALSGEYCTNFKHRTLEKSDGYPPSMYVIRNRSLRSSLMVVFRPPDKPAGVVLRRPSHRLSEPEGMEPFFSIRGVLRANSKKICGFEGTRSLNSGRFIILLSMGILSRSRVPDSSPVAENGKKAQSGARFKSNRKACWRPVCYPGGGRDEGKKMGVINPRHPFAG